MAVPPGDRRALPVGKLPAELLAALLARTATSVPSPDLLLGPRPGEDAAAVRVGDRALVLASDPVTFATTDIGWYAVHLNANDVATRGASPRWFLATLLLPEGATPDLPLAITEQIVAACREVGATLVGGHTEVTAGLPRPIVAGTMVGEVAIDRLLTTGGAQVGDALVLTQAIAIEGTALIAMEFPDAVTAAFGPAFTDRCRDFLHRPGLSVVPAARLAAAAGAHALHDPTEGGLATALHELADAADCGVWLDGAAVPIFPETQALCDRFGLDPLGLLASGALLIAVGQARLPHLQARLATAGIAATTIGAVTPATEGRQVVRHGRASDVPRFTRDEITRLFG